MRYRRHVLRDTVWLTLPLVVLLVYLSSAAATGFYNAEIRNFHGYLIRKPRIGGPANYIRETLRPVTEEQPRRYLPSRSSKRPAGHVARRLDLRVKGKALDALESDLPASGEVWQKGVLMEDGVPHPVEVRHRGQAFANFFFHRSKTWKIKTGKRGLIDGYRVINLSPLRSRLLDHLGFHLAREVGLPTSRTRVVHLYINKKDKGLYLQEEQVDESLMRRCDRMPGDVFYGELSIPNEAKRGSTDLFWNPFLWRKKGIYNRHDEQHRPHLVDLLDAVNDESLGSYDRLQELLDEDEYPLYFAVLSYYGEMHTDRAHNHKMFFNPLTGRFEGVVWNLLPSMPKGRGVETTAAAIFRKLCEDPRFLDRVQRHIHDFHEADLMEVLAAEADRVAKTYSGEALSDDIPSRVEGAKRLVRMRADTIEKFQKVADAAFTAADGTLSVHGCALASLRLEALRLAGPAAGVRLWEDREFDGAISADDRAVKVRADGNVLRVEDDAALVYVGRDFRAPWYEPAADGGEAFQQFRTYTRLAWLESRYLLSDGARVEDVELGRTVGQGDVAVRAGAPDGYVSRETVHPWRMPQPPAPRHHRFRGEVKLSRTLLVRAQDTFEAEPGTRFLLGPDVSIHVQARIRLDGVTFERLDETRPWGVFALLGKRASGSVLENCRFRGGSDDTIAHVYYSGMFSAHYAHGVVVRNCTFADNLRGDDTVRFACCHDLLIDGCRVERANGDAIDCDISQGTIRDTLVLNPRNDGIDLMTADVRLERNRVTGAGDKGISFGESANPEVVDMEIVGCVTGIGLKDASDPKLLRVEIRKCRTAISSYDKNWRYPGGGRGTLTECTLLGNERDLKMDPASTLRLERCRVSTRFRPPANALREGRLVIVDPQEEGR